MAITQRQSTSARPFVGDAKPVAERQVIGETRERAEVVEQIFFWLYVAAIAWVPFWYGSNDWLPWGVNAMLFPGLTGLYEVSILVRGKSHPVGLRYLMRPVRDVRGGGVVDGGPGIAAEQLIVFANPIWAMTADALGHRVTASISVNRDLTILGLIRLITAASAFWLGLQLCRDQKRADGLIVAIAAIGAAYAFYGLLAMKLGQLPVLHYIPQTAEKLNSTFINPDSYSTYAGIGFIASAGLVLRFYGGAMSEAAGNWRLQLWSFVEITGGQGAALLVAGFLTLTALLLTGSRGGFIATGFGFFVLMALSMQRNRGTKNSSVLLLISFVLVAVTLFVFGNVVGGKLATGGVYDGERFSVYLLTLRSILAKPWLGWGYGTFPDVFPMFRDRSISVLGTWSQAHNTYLEIFQGLGVIGGTLLLGCVVTLVMRCVAGTRKRQREVIAPCVAASAAFLVGAHALVDFSLQMQAVALTFVVVLAAGVAQSESSRVSLED